MYASVQTEILLKPKHYDRRFSPGGQLLGFFQQAGPFPAQSIFQQERAELAGVRRAVERMPDETRAMLQHHISAWRDGQHDWWTRYLLEDLAVVANRDDRWPAA